MALNITRSVNNTIDVDQFEALANSKEVLNKVSSLSDTAKELNAGTQQTSAETEEQYAIMEGIRNNLQNVMVLMEELSKSVNQFKVNEMIL